MRLIRYNAQCCVNSSRKERVRKQQYGGGDVPNAVHICQDMTSPPRIMAGEFSAEKTGTVTSLRPMPRPRSILQAASWPHVCERPIPKGARREKMAAMKMTPRRPSKLFRGSDSHPALRFRGISLMFRGGQRAWGVFRRIACSLWAGETLTRDRW